MFMSDCSTMIQAMLIIIDSHWAGLSTLSGSEFTLKLGLEDHFQSLFMRDLIQFGLRYFLLGLHKFHRAERAILLGVSFLLILTGLHSFIAIVLKPSTI